jgi:hypothetical protein
MIDVLVRFSQILNAGCVGMAMVTHRPMAALGHFCVVSVLLIVEAVCADE